MEVNPSRFNFCWLLQLMTRMLSALWRCSLPLRRPQRLMIWRPSGSTAWRLNPCSTSRSTHTQRQVSSVLCLQCVIRVAGASARSCPLQPACYAHALCCFAAISSVAASLLAIISWWWFHFRDELLTKHSFATKVALKVAFFQDIYFI